MRAVIIIRQGAPVAPNVECVDDWPVPVPGPGELVVATEAAAMNHLDLYVGRGVPGLDLTYPRIAGSDGCGRVESVGEGVDESWVGRRVLLNAAVEIPARPAPDVVPTLPFLRMIGEHDHGAFAAKFVAPASNVLDVGDADPVEAAAFALVHLTAWRMLVTRAGLTAGQTVLITGIGGGVALAALGICRHFDKDAHPARGRAAGCSAPQASSLLSRRLGNNAASPSKAIAPGVGTPKCKSSRKTV